jgi:hypothetical protein
MRFRIIVRHKALAKLYKLFFQFLRTKLTVKYDSSSIRQWHILQYFMNKNMIFVSILGATKRNNQTKTKLKGAAEYYTIF